MSLIRPPGATRIGDLIIDKGSPEEEQERGALERFFDSLIYGAGPSGGVSNEFPFPSYTPPSREGSFGTGFLPAIAPTTTPPAASTTTPPASSTDDGSLDNILGGAKDATKAVAGVIDSGLQILGDIFGMGDPSLVVLNPTNPNATVVYGTPTGSATPTIIGSMPKSGAPVGVMTGIPAMDEILAGIFNQRGQGGKSTEEIIRSVILGKIGTETGYPLEGVAGAIEGGLTGNFEDVVNSVGKVVLQIDKKLEDEVGVNPYSVIPKANVGEVDPNGPQNVKTDPTPYDMVAGTAGTFNPNDVGPIRTDPYSIIKTTFPPVDPSAGVIKLPPPRPPITDGPDFIKTTFPPVGPSTIDLLPPGETKLLPVTPPSSGPMIPGVGSGFRGVALTPGDLVELNYLFDIGGEDIFAPMVQGGVEKRNISPYATKASGGIVSKQSIDELFRILGV